MHALTKFATALTLCVGFAACSSTMPGDDRGPDGTPNSPDQQAESLSLAGSYTVKSKFQVTPEKLGTSGDFAIDLQDLADDPVEVLAEMIADEVGLDFLAGSIEGWLKDAMDGRETKLTDAISDFLTASLNFDLVSELVVDGSGSSVTMTHAPTGMEVTIDGKAYEYAFEDLKADSLEQYSIAVSGSKGNNLTFKAHDVEVPYGKMLETVLDQVVVPAIDSGASDLGDALQGIIDCNAVGQSIYDDLQFGSASVYASGCRAGADALAREMLSKIGDNQSLTFAVTIDGKATASDSNNDGKADSISGRWDSIFLSDLENKLPTPFKAKRTK